MKIINIKYLLSISLIIIVAILYLSFVNTQTRDQDPERAILVLQSELGGTSYG